jgi:hypothetical protein
MLVKTPFTLSAARLYPPGTLGSYLLRAASTGTISRTTKSCHMPVVIAYPFCHRNGLREDANQGKDGLAQYENRINVLATQKIPQGSLFFVFSGEEEKKCATGILERQHIIAVPKESLDQPIYSQDGKISNLVSIYDPAAVRLVKSLADKETPGVLVLGMNENGKLEILIKELADIFDELGKKAVVAISNILTRNPAEFPLKATP